MKNNIFIFLFVAFMPVWLVAQNDVKMQADEAYKQENYRQAAELYEGLLADGVESHEVYYNLGCAYFRMNELGLAIVNFERAKRLNPSDKDTRENLELCYSRTQDHIEQLPQPLVSLWWQRLVMLFSPQQWYGLLLLMILLVGVCVVWFLLSSELRQRRATLIASVLAVVLMLVVVGCAVQSGHNASSHKDAVVMRAMATVKSSPDGGSNDKFTLHEGTKVRVEETLGDWSRIRIADGNNGWLRADEIERI
ncbi:MAG: tetratricopeptide repeat protein [Bacteroidales bacterium]|nr:tetratricopeptide repeat protein [Bacteroidales bacterium]